MQHGRCELVGEVAHTGQVGITIESVLSLCSLVKKGEAGGALKGYVC